MKYYTLYIHIQLKDCEKMKIFGFMKNCFDKSNYRIVSDSDNYAIKIYNEQLFEIYTFCMYWLIAGHNGSNIFKLGIKGI